MRQLYSILIALAAPFALAWNWWRGLRDPAYRDRLGERLGLTGLRFESGCLWLHAASVGEIQAAATLIHALMHRFANVPLLITTTTPTGAQRVRALFGDRVQHCFLPYDTAGSVRRFLERTRPRAGVFIETELWPNLYRQCQQRGIPLVLASARVSPRSFPRYRRLAGLFKGALDNVEVAAQTDEDTQRFRALGAPRTHTVGNIKFDLEIPPAAVAAGRSLREAQFPDRPVWIAASTREGEESIVLDGHAAVRQALPDALLILVPRHPQRFAEVSDLLQRRRTVFVKRSEPTSIAHASVLLVDTMGELVMCYAASDVAFVGGTLVPVGGHNFLEPAALSLPVLSGPHVFNSQVLCDQFFAQRAAIKVHDADELARSVEELLVNAGLRKEIGGAGLAIVEANRGAVERVVELVVAAAGQRLAVQADAVRGTGSSSSG